MSNSLKDFMSFINDHPLGVALKVFAATALTYVVDRSHEQYASPQPAEEVAQRVSQAAGKSGANRDYVFNTIGSLRELGIRADSISALISRSWEGLR